MNITIATKNLQEVAAMISRLQRKEVRLAVEEGMGQLTNGISYISGSGATTIIVDENKAMSLLRSVYQLAIFFQFVAGIASFVCMPMIKAYDVAKENFFGKGDSKIAGNDEIRETYVYVNKAVCDFVMAVVEAAGVEFIEFEPEPRHDETDRFCFRIKAKTSEIERFQGIANEAALMKQA